MKIEKLTQRELRILAIVFCSAMEHDWNDWFDGDDGMTGETEQYCGELYKKLIPIFEYLGEDGLENFIKNKKQI
jgi:hypothetical protein